MRIHISPTDGVPIYMQIVQQVRRLVAAGELIQGDDLPSIRVLAEQLVINPNTVARAYRELEADGLVSSSRGLGTYISANNLRSISEGRQERLRPLIDELLHESRALGVSFEELLDHLRLRQAATVNSEFQEKVNDR
jgi:GntR family transcriptional regulator